jgi:hypothetical protein
MTVKAVHVIDSLGGKTRRKTTLEDFEVLHVLGKGAFGEVGQSLMLQCLFVGLSSEAQAKEHSDGTQANEQGLY